MKNSRRRYTWFTHVTFPPRPHVIINILRLEMDPCLAEDDQAKGMTDDTLEVGGGGSESMTNDRSALDETASSEKSIAGVDSAKDICILSAQTYHVSYEVRDRRSYMAADLQRSVINSIRDLLFNDPCTHP